MLAGWMVRCQIIYYVSSHDTVRFQWASIGGRQIVNLREVAENLVSEFTVVFGVKV
jgi:hypothetical protein